MPNRYVEFISDKHFLDCVSNLYDAYARAKEGIDKKKFYKNKVDVIKLTFDAKFGGISERMVIQNEIIRQIDKSINNAIGMFHEQVLGGIEGYEKGNASGYDIKATDNTLFADIKNKHNTMNSSSSESLFQKLASYADTHKKATCYWVQILAKKSFCEKWEGEINGKEYSHSRVFKISGDQFYALLTKKENAFFELYKALPLVIADFLKQTKSTNKGEFSSALNEIERAQKESERTLFEQITYDNFGYYLGFKEL